jgi:hypothetical protein
MALKIQRAKRFKVAAVSSNSNSFGLTGMVLVARDGTAYQVGASDLHLRRKGSVIAVPITGRRCLNFAQLGFEIPERLPQAPSAVVAEVWN